jgi:transposase InsO family protein
MGRPPRYGAADKARITALVAEERGLQGRTAGEGVIHEGLRLRGHALPLRLVREALRAQKALERAEERRAREERRVSHEIMARDTIWGEDALFVTREAGRRVEGELLRDAATTRALSLSCGSPATASDVIEQLERTAIARGSRPLLLQTDNGPAYASEALACYLERHQILHLRSRLRTPTDNPATERAIGELRRESGVGPTNPTPSAAQACGRLATTALRLNRERRRRSRGYRTAAELDDALPRADQVVDRAAFYAEARARAQAARLGARSARDARARERRALFDILIEHGLATRRMGARRVREGTCPLTPTAPAARMIP